MSHLIYFYNGFLKEECFPSILKKTRVQPSYKSGDKRDPNNYRPISLTSTFSKTFEKLISNKIVPYLEDENILINSQFGYRTGRSPTDAIHFTINKIVNSLSSKLQTSSIFLDLSKAFDRVIFNILLKILYKIGFSESLLNLFRSFLENREQYVCITRNGIEYKSDIKTPTCSVPQGTILGPLFFLLYVNFLPVLADIKEEDVCMFCDDNTLFFCNKCSLQNEININNKINAYVQVLNDFNLSSNSHKTKFINFKTGYNQKPHLPSVFIDDERIEEVESFKLLGIHIDQYLNWNIHVKNILNKLSSSLFLLKQLAPVCNRTTLFSAYHALVHSHISYGILCWGSTSDTNLDDILKCQKKALRAILHLPDGAHCQDLFRKHKILTVFGQFALTSLLYIKNNIETFPEAKIIEHNHNTRFKEKNNADKDKIALKNNSHLKIVTKNAECFGVKLFNLLPIDTRKLPLKEFKKLVKDILIEAAPYNMEELEMAFR